MLVKEAREYIESGKLDGELIRLYGSAALRQRERYLSLLSDFEKIKAVEVTVRKPDAPIRADFGYVAVSIRRERHG